nr:cytochrome c [uncultured Flavobacterium sp.]
MKKTIALTILLAGLWSCSSDTPETIEPKPDVVTPPTATVITYNANVKAIVDNNCVRCHSSGGTASFRPLTTFAQVKAAVENANLLGRIQLQNGQSGLMPQGGRMSQANIDAIVKWNTDGLKEN